jgi:hypothetical protein
MNNYSIPYSSITENNYLFSQWNSHSAYQTFPYSFLL